MKLKEIIRKEPFKRMLPYSGNVGYTSSNKKMPASLPDNQFMIVPQERMLAELNPSAHDVNNPYVRKDKEKRDKDKKLIDHIPVARIAVPLQRLISTKQKVHLTAKDLKWTLTEQDRSDAKEKTFVSLKQGWKDKNMHVYLAEWVESWLDTGDGALYMYRDDSGKFGCKDFGFKKGDVLLPHYDYYGNLEVFGRLYSNTDSDGNSIAMLDVFDKENVTTYKQRGLIGKMLTLSDWGLVGNPRPHGFDGVPIVYKRGDDACWSDVQNLIDQFDEALSNMSENNRYYANMILFIKGEVGSLPDRGDAGKVIKGKGDADAKFLATSESNEAQVNELNILLKHIMLGSFTVDVSPDSVKSSGDLPGITVKLLFSPATEKAVSSAKKLDASIDRLVELFKFGYGLEIKKQTEFTNLKCRAEIDVFTPQNEAELAQIINDGINSTALSVKTGNENYPVAISGETERVEEQVQKERAAEIAGSINLNNTSDE